MITAELKNININRLQYVISWENIITFH